MSIDVARLASAIGTKAVDQARHISIDPWSRRERGLGMRSFFITVACGLALVCEPASAEIMTLDSAAKLFGSRETGWAAKLSPSGKQMLLLAAGAGAKTELDLHDFATRETSTLLLSPGTPETLEWCDFATETRIVCEFGGNKAVGPQIVSFSRLVTISTNGKDLKPLGTKTTSYDSYIRQYDGNVIDWLSDQPGSVLVERNYVPQVDLGETGIADTREGLGVDQIDLTTLKSATVEPVNKRAAGYWSDDRGHVRLMALNQVDPGTNLTSVTEFRFRRPGSSDWIKFGSYDEKTEAGCFPQAVVEQTNSVYCLEKVDGRDALFAAKLDGSSERKLIARNDRVDIDGVVRLDRGMPVIGYKYTEDRTHIVYFDPEYQKLAQALSRALPDSPLIYFASSSADRNLVLVHASSDTDSGAYYLLDRRSLHMDPVLLSRDSLENHHLAPMRPVTYAASDGTSIPAYITVAPDAPAGPKPGVVLPHGGPSARDRWGFDWLAQFFAARGYVVIQPNYRGSSGYGSDFLGDNAFRNWRKAMSDIDDAALYLIKQGLADPKRMSIVGWSYGGYAALESAVLHPERYKAVVAIAPVTDLKALKSDALDYTSANLVRQAIGPSDQAAQGSPLRFAERIAAPVLLVHGDLDNNVRISHSLRMADALKKNGKAVELLRFPKLDHQLDDSEARIQMLTKIGELLDRTIGH